MEEIIKLQDLPSQRATGNERLYEHPETGEYVWKEDLPNYVVDTNGLDQNIIKKL